MAIGIIMEFDGMGEDVYEGVREKINWPDNWADGIQHHLAGPVEGGMRIVEVRDSREQYDRWMAETIQPALREVVGAETLESAPPPRVTEFDLRRSESR